MLTVALDATPLLGARTGIGVAVAGYVENLAPLPEVRLAAYGLTGRGWHSLASQLPPGVGSRRRPAPAALLLAAWERWDWPPAEWWTGAVDVVHGTNFVVPPTRRAGRIVSVWDLTAVRFPEMCAAASLRYPALVARAVKRGAWVHTGTSAVADEVIEHFGVDPGRVRVVPPAVLSRPQGGPPSKPAGGRPYILSLGRSEPRKDIPSLIEAFGHLAASLPDVDLVIAGPAGWGEQKVADAIDGSAWRGRIHRVGWVDDTAALLAGAAVFAYPSVYEGFGLPPLEAMAAGVPVVATAAGAVAEVVGSAAVLVEPGDTAELAAALEEVLTVEARRSELIAAGRQRVSSFDGKRAAEGLIEAYREVAAG